jgi:hypothetical protein
VIVWMWDTDGPDRAVGGVTDNEERARRAVEALMLSGQTTAARVEMVHLVTGFGALTSHYQRGLTDARDWQPGAPRGLPRRHHGGRVLVGVGRG